ncbi:GyrI-like domain-containing protein [Aquibium oceanicum]|uniref:AraC effector-binding domain-containing protein n=1 Tax=Aquibium oceanicum TaxID=1670800 RepID=A0A1L3SNV2_9HYPH|nr:GyrI-like domain-containing protein [Aquibium oceanicum]APH71083.1 hypothetical protein BSQ44_06645 [Aquibium oceanicum]
MLTLPSIVERPAVPFLALRRNVALPFDDEIPEIMDELFSALRACHASPAGPVFFKHNIVDMPALEMDFGVPVDSPPPAAGPLEAGILPAGRYAEITYLGAYDDLVTVNGVLIAWALRAGLVFDSVRKSDGEHFASRLEIYHNGLEEEADPSNWKTTVSIKLKD